MTGTVERRRADCAHRFMALSEAEPRHFARDGLRRRVGRWKRGVPLGPEALTYAQIDAWRDAAIAAWRRARRAEIEGDAVTAERSFREAAELLGAITVLLHSIEARHGGAPSR